MQKNRLAKAVGSTMIFNTASTIANLSLNSQNRPFSWSGIELIIGFLVLQPIKISFVKPEACAIILLRQWESYVFSTASPIFKFIKQRNKKSKMNVPVSDSIRPTWTYLGQMFISNMQYWTYVDDCKTWFFT